MGHQPTGAYPLTCVMIDLLGLGSRNDPKLWPGASFSTSDWQELTQDSIKCLALCSGSLSPWKASLTPQVTVLVFSSFLTWTEPCA